MMHYNNEKGFTVIELVLSFALVMFLAIVMFAVVNSYRNRQQIETANRDLTVFKNKITQDIYEDINEKKVKKIEYCTDASGEIIKQCIIISFKNNTEKKLEIVEESRTINVSGTEMNIKVANILYGEEGSKVKYENPVPKLTKIVSDYMLTYSKEEDNLEYGTIYKIEIRLEHQDIEEEFKIEVITTGSE